MRRTSGRGVVILVVLTVVTLIAIDVRTGFLGSVGDAFAEILGAVQSGLRTVASPLTNTIDAIGEVGELRTENENLTKENTQLESRLSESKGLVKQNQELRELFGLTEEDNVRRVATGEVIASSPSSLENFVTINRGSRHGVEVSMAVVAADGLVGRIERTTPSTSRVQLITDPASSVGVSVARTSEFGLLRGLGRSSSGLVVELIDPTALDEGLLEVSDILFTLGGEDGLFPSGIPVGQITQAKAEKRGSTATIRAAAIVRMSALSVVSVVTTQRD